MSSQSKKSLFFMLLLLLGSADMESRSNSKSNENPIAVLNQIPGFVPIFHSWGFIGDSLSSGEHEFHRKDGSIGYADFYEYSWGQRMCRLCGVKGENYSQGGETAKGWIEHFWDEARNNNNNISAKTDPKQAYIIALGVNDRYQKFTPGNASTDINLNDYHLNNQTYAGYYGGIIQRIKELQPDARFFVVTNPERINKDKHREDNPYNVQVRKMAEIFSNVYVIDLERYEVDYNDENFKRNYFTGGHLNAMGYERAAWVMMTYINWIIRHHQADFTQVGFIGTKLKY